MPLALSRARAGSTSICSTYPSPSPQRAAVARRPFLIVDRGAPGGGTHGGAPTAESPAGQQRNPCAAKLSEGVTTTARHTPLSPRAGANRGWRGGAEEELGGPASPAPANRRLRERRLCPHLGSPGRRSAAASPLPSAAGAAAAPPCAEPGLLPGPPRLCRAHTGTRGGGRAEGEGERARGGGSGGRELRTARRSRLQSRGSHAGGETSRLRLLGGRGGSPRRAVRTGAPRGSPRRRGGPSPTPLGRKRRRERARPPALGKRGLRERRARSRRWRAAVGLSAEAEARAT